MEVKEKLRSNERRPKGKPFVIVNECRDDHPYIRAFIKIRPDGFWSDTVKIDQNIDYDCDLKLFRWEEPDINWSYGGRGGDIECDDIQASKNFIAALQEGIAIAERWKRRVGQPVKPGDV